MGDTIEKNVDSLVEKLIESYPVLSIDNIINDLERSIEQIGVKVSYADLSSIETEKGFKKIEGYARVLESGSPTIIVNGNNCLEKRRMSMAHLLSEILLYWKWKPYEKIKHDRDLHAIHQLELEDLSVRKKYVSRLAENLLLPKSDVEDTFNFFKSIESVGLRKTLVEGLLSSAYKVPSGVIKSQIEYSCH